YRPGVAAKALGLRAARGRRGAGGGGDRARAAAAERLQEGLKRGGGGRDGHRRFVRAAGLPRRCTQRSLRMVAEAIRRSKALAMASEPSAEARTTIPAIR